MAFDVCSPCVLNNNATILFRLANSLIIGADPYSAYFRFSKALSTYKSLSASCRYFHAVLNKESNWMIKSCRLKINSSDMDPFLEVLDELDDSKFELANHELIAKCTGLTKLVLRSTNLSSTSILSSLSKLQSLELKLPNISDFSALKHLTALTQLALCCPTIESMNGKPVKLEKDFLIDLFRALKHLRSVVLSYVEIECIDSELLQSIPALGFLELNNSIVGKIHEDALKKWTGNIHHLKLDGLSFRDASSLTRSAL